MKTFEQIVSWLLFFACLGSIAARVWTYDTRFTTLAWVFGICLLLVSSSSEDKDEI